MASDLVDGRDATLAATEGAASALRVHAIEIRVSRGPDAGRVVRVDRPTFVIGSGASADLRLADPAVSREHLRLSLETAGVRVRDEGSKNGTFIGTVRVADVVLSAEATLSLGKTSLDIRIETSPLDLPLSDQAGFGGALGVSAAMRHLFALLERAAASDVTILLEGESGVGKEVLAHAIHAQSPRCAGPFVALDCGAIPHALIEAELFGHERGAFTGASQARQGVFEQAAGGTLFLDEIGELPLDLQPKLLRVLEQREVRPIGATGTRAIDVRLVAATNRRLAEASQRNEFRRDLFYRLAVARVTVPPLRDRRDDVLPLARSFLRVLTRDATADLPADIAAMLMSYSWPGNVRELRNVMERYALLGLRDAKGLLDTVNPVPFADLSELPFREARRVALDRFERGYVPRVLERAGGVVAEAARMAEVARPSFYRMLERLRLAPGGGDDEDPEGRVVE